MNDIKGLCLRTWQHFIQRGPAILLVMLLGGLIAGAVFVGLSQLALHRGLPALGLAALDGQQLLEQILTGNNLHHLMEDPVILTILGLSLALALILASWWLAAVLVAVVQEQRGIFASLCLGWKYLVALLWINTLWFGILLSTSLVLLGIGGLFLLVAFAFTWYIMVEEQRPGLDALMASRFYVQGQWWPTLLKLSLPVLLLTPVAFIPYAGPLLLFCLSPFVLLYTLNIYRDLKEARGQEEPNLGCTCLWLPLALTGILLPLLGFIGAAVIWGPMFPQKISQVLHSMGLPVASQGLLEQEQQEQPPVVQSLASVDGFSIWRLGPDTENKALHIKEVSALGEQGELSLTIALTRPFAEHFAIQQTKFHRLINFYFDMDLNSATGSPLPLGEEGRSGYDMEVEVLLAREEESTGAGQAFVSLYRLDGENRNFMVQLYDQDVLMEEQQLSIRLSYEHIHARLGQTIKICFIEASQGPAQDKAVPLK